MKRDDRLPEWWQEFHPVVYSMDRNCVDAKIKSLACWQAVAFCLPAAQKEVHGAWITPPCLAGLGRKEYFALVHARMTGDYQEQWREESVALALVLQGSAIHARASPNVFCRAVQELHDCLVPMVEEGNLLNMEMEIED